MKTKKSNIVKVFLFALSAILLIIGMPPFLNIPFLGFFALVPVILGMRIYSDRKNIFSLTIFYGLFYTSVSYIWYVDIFSSIWGYFLIVAVAFWHSGLIRTSIKLEKKILSEQSIFILPIVYAILEFAQRNIPFIKEWWFIQYPKISWGFPEALWMLSLTGITGVTFVMILSNSTLAKIIQNKIEHKRNSKVLYLNIIIVVLYLSFGFYYVNNDYENSYNIAVISDMANDISGQVNEGLYVKDREISNKILNYNLNLSRKIADNSDFIVWSENEFFNFDDEKILDELKKFSKQTKSFLVVDSYIQKEKLYDAAVLITPDNSIGGFAKKTYLFNDEIEAGFSPNDDEIRTFMANNLRVGLGVCYDFHFTDIVKKLAHQNAKLILMTRDDDMNRNKFFPFYHSTDAVFRAIENNVAIASANTNGASIVVMPNGKISAYSEINKLSADIGKSYISNKQTIYTKYGEWFSYLLIVVFLIFILYNIKKSRK